MIPNRKIALNFSGVRWVGGERGDRSREGHAGQDGGRDGEHDSGDAAAPNSTITSVKTVAMSSIRAAIQARLPSATSRPLIGVAYIAWKTRLHWRPAMIGKVDSNAADCIAVDASRPGARNAR